jgi:hypothetical protein
MGLTRVALWVDFCSNNEFRSTTLQTNPAFHLITRVFGFGTLLAISYYLGESAALSKAPLCRPMLPRTTSDLPLAVKRYPGVQGMTNLWREYDHLNRSADASLLYSDPMVWDRRDAQVNSDLPGQRVVVMSADSRPLVPLRTMQPGDLEEQFSTVTAIYNTWWAVRHGYDYRRVEISPPSGFYRTWGKVKAIYDMLHRYDLVVFFDGDVFVSQPDLGLKDMMDRWGFHERASIMAAMEPPGQPAPNQNATNFGFLVLRSNNVTKQIFRRLTYCVLGRTPEGETEPFVTMGCEKYRTELYHEQTAFNLYLRPHLREGEDFIISPCRESNGFWEHYECKGLVITHAWTGKNKIFPPMRDLMAMHHFQLYEKLLWSDYHYSNCSSWSFNDERCQVD